MKMLTEMCRLEMKSLLRFFPVVFFSLVFPSMALLLFGGMYGNEPSELFGGYGTVDVSIPSYMAIIFLNNGLMTLPLNLAAYRENKILKRFMATPLHPGVIIISQIIVNILIMILGIFILIIVGKLVFDMKFIGSAIPMLEVCSLSALSLFALGFVIASVSPNMRTANAAANLIYFPMLFISGTTIPTELMPDFMHTISKAFPATYAVTMQKGVWLGGSLMDYKLEIAVLLAVLFAGAIISVKTFRWE